MTIPRPVTVEHHREPIGIGLSRPRLSWVVDTDEPGWTQRAHELEIATPGGRPPLRTGRVETSDQVLVAWPDEPLGSRRRRSVRVRVWGDAPEPSAWSAPTELETGLLDPADWQARLVAPPLPPAGDGGEPAMLLRGEADLPVGIRSARVRASAHGVMTLSLNGTPVGDDVLHPGWTSYRHRLRYRTWDVTSLVRAGRNAIGVHLADGWYRGYLGFGGLRGLYGDRTAALVQLEVERSDGTLLVVGTDGSWRSTPGPVTRADLYMGETHDLRRVPAGWEEPGFDDSAWDPVDDVGLDPAVLVAPDGPPIRRTEWVRPVTIGRSVAGATIVDFGQNLVGRLRIRVPAGEPGQVVTFRHAEVLDAGELGTRPLRRARATDELVLDGSPGGFWEPSFTVHGFRYAQVEGWPGELCPDDVEAVVLHSDMRQLGTFGCSDPLLEQLHDNVRWSMRGNFLDVPTDCPQRDERLGWTGDLQVFAPAASFLYDTSGLLTGWLADLTADQHDDGTVPLYVPWADVDPQLPPLGAEAGWGDAATVVPWTLYERYGDARVLRAQWRSMTGWVDALARRAGPEIDFPDGFALGDWLDPAAPDDRPWQARVPWQLVATAYLARSARIVRDAAEVLGETAAAARYRTLTDRATARFRSEYVTATGRAAFAAQTAYALAIVFDLLLPEQRAHAGELLAGQVAADGFHIGTGFLGTPVVCDALADTGQDATLWPLLLQRGCPSWLYPVTMGATTIWERWDSMLPDGSINPGEMTSFNHYAFGAVADFLHRRVAGLAPAAPGYRRLRVCPLPTRRLSWARATHDTPYGHAEVAWQRDGDTVELRVVLPPSTAADVVLPDGAVHVVAAGTHTFRYLLPPEQDPATIPNSFPGT